MKINNFEQDNENIPIKISDNSGVNNYEIINQKKSKKKYFNKKNIIFFFTIFIIFILIYLANNNREIAKLNKKLEDLESKIETMDKQVIKKKIGIAFVFPYLFGNGIGRLLSILTELLVKTGRYDVYLINEKTTELDYKYHKKVKRVIQKKNQQDIRDFDEANDIQIYIMNNDVSDLLNLYHSLGKKVIGIFHGAYLSYVFTQAPNIYKSWHLFSKFDSFVHIIPDDYWVYKKFGFNNSVFIPNLYTFDSIQTASSNLTYNNVLMVGRVDDVIKGGKFGIYAMKEILNEVPDAKLTIVAPYPPKFIINLIKELKIGNGVRFIRFTKQISQYYLNASVLLVTSVSESFPMVMNEAKAYGLPIVSFDIDYSPCFQKGVITVDMFNYTLMGKEAAKLLKNYEYRKRVGREAKLSLNIFNNNDTILMWENLFNSLINGTEDYKKFQNEVEKEYYNEKLAKEHIEKHYKYGQKFNKRFSCHTFENFTNLSYINSIGLCQNNSIT